MEAMLKAATASGVEGGDGPLSMEQLIRKRMEEAETPEDAYKKLVEDAQRQSEQINGKAVKPEPGFCMKTTQNDGSKIFINYCHSDKVWPPKKDATDKELEAIIETGDNRNFSVPVAMSDPRVELDKSGKGCTVYTCIVNTKLIRDSESRPLLRQFLMEMALQHVEVKSNVLLSRDVKILRRKYMGTLHEQHIRSNRDPKIAEVSVNSPSAKPGVNKNSPSSTTNGQARPKIEMMEDPEAPTASSNPISSLTEPDFTLLKEPEENPDFLCLEIQLPQARNMKGTTLDVGTKKVELVCKSFGYGLTTRLPCAVLAKEGGAQFDKQSHVLTVTLPVAK